MMGECWSSVPLGVLCFLCLFFSGVFLFRRMSYGSYGLKSCLYQFIYSTLENVWINSNKNVDLNIVFPYAKKIRVAMNLPHFALVYKNLALTVRIRKKLWLPNKVSSGGWFCFFGQPRSHGGNGILEIGKKCKLRYPDITPLTWLY